MYYTTVFRCAGTRSVARARTLREDARTRRSTDLQIARYYIVLQYSRMSQPPWSNFRGGGWRPPGSYASAAGQTVSDFRATTYKYRSIDTSLTEPHGEVQWQYNGTVSRVMYIYMTSACYVPAIIPWYGMVTMVWANQQSQSRLDLGPISPARVI